MGPPPRTRSRLGEAIRQIRKDAELTQQQLADAVGIAQPRVSDWEGTLHLEVEEALDLLGRIDEACGRPHGTILRMAAYIDNHQDVNVLAAIDRDPTITDEIDRECLRVAYRLFRSRPVAGGEHSEPGAVVSDLERSLGEQGLSDALAQQDAARVRTRRREADTNEADQRGDAPAEAG